MPALVDAVPNYVEAITIFADDDPDRKSERCTRALADALKARGFPEIRIEGLNR